LEEAELGMHGWQEQWDSFNTRSAEPRRQAEVQQARLAQLEASLERLAERQRKLGEERDQLGGDSQDTETCDLDEQVASSELLLEDLQLQERQVVEQLDALREQMQQANQAQQQQQGDLQRLGGRLASLEALQQAALEPGVGAADWLRAQGLEQRPRLAEGLRVEPGWELAVETVLGADLQAVLLDDFTGLEFAALEQGELRLLMAGAQGASVTGSLLDKVEGSVDLSPWLGQVIPVETLEQALSRRGSLGAGQSLVSRDGYWVGRHFLRVSRGGEAQGGVLARGQEIERLGREQLEQEALLEQLDEQLQRLREQQLDLEEQREQLRRRSQDESRQHGELKARLSAGRARAEQLELRRRRLQEELAELQEQRALEHEQLGEARLLLQEALDLMAQDTEKRELLMARRDTLREGLDRIRQEARQHKDHAHQLAVRLGSLRAQHDSTRQALERLEQQAARLSERQEQLNLNLEEGEAPLEELRLKLEELLERRMSVDEEMRQARLHMDEADRELRDAERRRTQA
ncbi:MAG: chromosome segregation protein SMC, partial [Pseudomonas sp.]|nr:chromosome segregation protein SMC [Pseudomonas sp.]